jgi:DNA polymerase-3 subunit chi
MTRIEFFILLNAEPGEKFAYGQRLVLQALARGRSVHVHTACASDTRSLISEFQHLENADRLSIDHKGEPEADAEVLINLSAEVPYFFSRFETTYEVVHDEKQARAIARERYRYYQERGYPLFHREIQPELV